MPAGQQSLPGTIEEDFDIEGDGAVKISLWADAASGKAEFLHEASWVLGPEPLISADGERILRVRFRIPAAN